jgi:hypothetical protein
MRYAYQPSFLRSTRQLSPAQAAKLLKAVEKFQSAMEQRQWPPGLGITHLRNAYFEFRVDIHLRVVYRRTDDLIHYVLYGTHDQISRFLNLL